MLTVPLRGADDVAGVDAAGLDAAAVVLPLGDWVAPPLQAAAPIATRTPSADRRLPTDVLTCNVSSVAQSLRPGLGGAVPAPDVAEGFGRVVSSGNNRRRGRSTAISSRVNEALTGDPCTSGSVLVDNA